MHKTSNKRLIILVSVLGIILMLLGMLVARYTLAPPSQQAQKHALPEGLQATYLPQGKPVTGLDLIDFDQQRFDETRFKGKWSFLFFGYTNCPDVCPSTMLVLKSIWAKLPLEVKTEPALQIIFVSVDPDRDNPEKLKKYVTFYHPEFLGITGKPDQIDTLTRQLGVLYGFDDDEKGQGYTVNHSAQIILIDPQGMMRGVFSTPHQVDEIVHSFVEIRKYYNAYQGKL